MRIVLASSSPRRQALMRQVGIPCDVMPCDIDETPEAGLSPGDAAAFVAMNKARFAAPLVSAPVLIIAADTTVCVDGRVLGKPAGAGGAFDMLKVLQGRSHTVYTGVAMIKIIDGAVETRSFTESASVYINPMSDDEINAYIATGEPMDKAGSYGAQEKGAFFVGRIEGDFHTVVGLPLSRVYKVMKEWGVSPLGRWNPGGA